jgi:hypothetical protein
MMMAKAPKQEPQNLTVEALANALTTAIQASKPPEKKTVFSRKEKTPWSPKEGEARLKLKRKLFQHGIAVDESFLTNEQIALANKVRPGSYCDGWINVFRRRDKGINIDYPVKTAAQRLRLGSFGILSFDSLLERLIKEADAPKKSEFDVSEGE